MAGKQDWANPFAKTEQISEQSWSEDNSDLDQGRITANGVGLRLGELNALDQIGDKVDLARNALIRFAVRRLILDYRAGKLDLESQTEAASPVRKPRRRLKMPKE